MLSLRSLQAAAVCRRVPVMLLLMMLLLFAWTSCLTCSPASLPDDPCGENEERACVSCVQATCWEPYIEEIQSCPDKFINQCQLGCNCKFGYLRHDESSKCVLAVDCQFIRRRRFKPIRFA